MKMVSRIIFITLMVAITSMVIACSEEDVGDNRERNNQNDLVKDNNEDEIEEPREEITIRWAHQWGEEHFQENFGKVIEDKFPHVTIIVQEAGTDHRETLEDLIAAKETPDVIGVGTVEHLYVLDSFGLAYDMDELIEKTGFDLNRFEPAFISNIRNFDPFNEQGLYAIPYNRPTWSLHYDKDVFDLLGVDYPVDGMTWEEVLELARELTREVGGVQYRGLDVDGWYASFSQFNENAVEPVTNDVIIDQSEGVKRFLEYIEQVVSIPGNYDADEPSSMLHHWGGLLEEGNIAMHPNKTNWDYIKENENIDIVSYPVWEGHEGIDPIPHDSGWAITEPSEYKEEILEILEYLLSDEIQMENSRNGDPSVLNNPDIHAVFGDNIPELKDKNLDSLFINEPASGPEEVADYADFVLWKAAVEFVDSNMDVNEYIRVLQEQGEESVRSQMESE